MFSGQKKVMINKNEKQDKNIISRKDFSVMKNMEIEKKYTLKQLPDNLESYPCKVIEQAYLNTSPVVRIRKSDESYYLTYKGSGLMAREEYNLPLDAGSYRHLLDKADGNIISKKRYVIPIENPQFDSGYIPIVTPQLYIELDVFAPPFAPLVMAEVEFPDEDMAKAFIPPRWFDKDVTNDIQYHNSTMSMKKFPQK